MKGLGLWFSSESTPKAQRNISSNGKSLLSQKKSALIERESVVACYDQTSSVEYANSKDPAMIKTVENPSALTITDACDKKMQRPEAWSLWRNPIPMILGKARDIVHDSGLKQAGDSCHEKGGTQKFLTVHSQL